MLGQGIQDESNEYENFNSNNYFQFDSTTVIDEKSSSNLIRINVNSTRRTVFNAGPFHKFNADNPNHNSNSKNGDSSNSEPSTSLINNDNNNNNPLITDIYSDSKYSIPLPDSQLPTPSIDYNLSIVYTWVNGSDPYHQLIRQQTLLTIPQCNTRVQKYLNLCGGNNRFRDNNELYYAIKTSQIFGKDVFNSIYIVRIDDKFNKSFIDNNDVRPSSGTNRWQYPLWLGSDSTEEYSIPIQLVSHSEIYPEHLQQQALPNFNSFSIELQLMNIPNVGKFVLANDDMMFARKLKKAYFYTPQLGYVIYTEENELVDFIAAPTYKPPSEWTALIYSNQLLCKKFGVRARPYISHYTAILDTEILKEIYNDFKQQFDEVSISKFRHLSSDIHIRFMFANYVIESHRAALIESFLEYKLDKDENRQYSPDERQILIDIIETTSQQISEPRKKPQVESDGEGVNYTWKSSYGYPWIISDATNISTVTDLNDAGQYQRINNNINNKSTNKIIVQTAMNCTQELMSCLPKEWFDHSASSVQLDSTVFISNIVCGDCLMNKVIQYYQQISPVKEKKTIQRKEIIHLFLPDQSHSQFDLAKTSIKKYSYVIGVSAARLLAISNFDTPYSLEKLKRDFEQANPVFICINDDSRNIPSTDTSKHLATFFQKTIFVNGTATE